MSLELSINSKKYLSEGYWLGFNPTYLFLEIKWLKDILKIVNGTTGACIVECHLHVVTALIGNIKGLWEKGDWLD